MDGNFHGLPTAILQNDHLRLEYLAEAGPRVVRLSLAGSEQNLLAETPEKRWETPFGEFWLRGGHRLWHAPESFPRTYIPDNEGLEVMETSQGVRLSGRAEEPTGIRKTIEIQLQNSRPALTLHHTLENKTLWPVECSAWAITQLPLGGVAVFPQQIGPLDPAGLLPNRQIVLWPYSRWSDSRLQLHDEFLLIQARAELPPVKIGYLNRQGWTGYFNQGVFFCKRFVPLPDRPHPDSGCNVESYCNDEFIELETLGPATRIEPGQSHTHSESWELYTEIETPSSPQEVLDTLKNLKLL